MRIGIDAHGVGGHSLGLGNETYFRNLIAALLDIDDQNEYHIFINFPEAMQEVVRDHANVKLVRLSPGSQWIQRPFSMPLYARRHDLDILHLPFVRPPITRCKTIVTIHDANYEVFPGDFSCIERWRMKMLVPWSSRHSNLIFTVSEHARKQIHDLYEIPLEKIVVTFNAADHMPRPPEETRQRIAQKFRLPKTYIFFAGLIQPKKNLPRLVQAFDLMKGRRNHPHHLVLAGKWGWGNAELNRCLSTVTHRDEIHFLGYQTAEEVAATLLGADMFAFPSLYESFAVPPLEAQQLGVPVLVSNSTCFPEIYGDSVLYCDPTSVDSIAEGLERLIDDASLRTELVSRGFERAKRYSWRKSAEIALIGYQKLFLEGVREPREVMPVQGSNTEG